MSALYYLGIIEGVAQAKGEDAYPIKFWHALKKLGEILQSPEILPTASHSLSSETKQKIIEIKDDIEELTMANFAEAVVENKKRKWSPEARARSDKRKAERISLDKKNQWKDEDKIEQFIKNKGMTKEMPPKVSLSYP